MIKSAKDVFQAFISLILPWFRQVVSHAQEIRFVHMAKTSFLLTKAFSVGLLTQTRLYPAIPSSVKEAVLNNNWEGVTKAMKVLSVGNVRRVISNMVGLNVTNATTTLQTCYSRV